MELNLNIFKYLPKNNLQNNLKKIYEKYGNNFNLRYKKKVLPIIFEKVKLIYNGIEYYELKYDIPKRTDYLIPLIISFIDIPSKEINNNSYINSIHKTDKISGSELVELALKINEAFGVNEVFINDGTNVKCGNQTMDLSFYSLISKNRTYYMKFGFNYYIKDKSTSLYIKFNNINDLEKTINNTIKIIKDIKINEIIDFYNNLLDLSCLIIKENNKKKIEIIEVDNFYYKPNNANWFRFVENPYEEIPEIINECYEMLNILNSSNDKYLYELLDKLFKDPNNCYKYNTIINNLLNMRYNYIYNKKEYKNNFILPFNLLKTIRHSYTLSYKF